MDDLDSEGRFNFYLRMYVNDLRLVDALVFHPEEVPHIDPDVLAWEMDLAWAYMEELIPQSHLDGIAAL